MKHHILLFITFLTVAFANAQSEHSLVEKMLQNYIDGSSYNRLDQLESAFIENATLYLTIKDEFKPITPKDYVAYFKNSNAGKFNGRYGKVLSIEVVKDIATAKVEISIPERNMVYMDLFLLKKTGNGWKIISKTATRIDEPKDD